MSRRPDPRVGVFDTLLAQGGVPVALAAHLQRLAGSVHALYDERLDLASIGSQVTALAGSGARQRIRVGFSPGTGATVEAEPLLERPRGPLRLVVRRVPGGWGGHKWCDRSLLARWGDPADPSSDLLLIDEDDRLLETGRGNIFVVADDGGVCTPPLDGRILPGITRETVLDSLPGLGLDGRAVPLSLADLAAATEVFVSSSIGGVRSVTRCDVAGPWPIGPVTGAVDDAVERAWAGSR